jgi:hypothetical protein
MKENRKNLKLKILREVKLGKCCLVKYYNDATAVVYILSVGLPLARPGAVPEYYSTR